MAEINAEKELRAAIVAVVRGDETDNEKRRDVIALAAMQKLSGMIPDNWNTDGSLKDARSVWGSKEQRDTANDVFAALSSAVADAYSDEYGRWYVWVQDWYGGGEANNPYMVVYCAGEELYAAEFSYDDENKVVLGEPTKVRPVTDYVERAPTPLREWRKKKIGDLKGLERRSFAASDMELREQSDGTLLLTGYASVTDTPYDVGFYTETIKRGAFRRTLGENPDVQLLINHEGMPLARTTSGTLRLVEDDRGLKVEADLDPEDPDVISLSRKMKRGDIDQMSFAFQATSQEWNEDYTARAITAASIHRGDVSVVNQGANPATAAALRSQDAIRALHRIGAEGFVAAWVEWRGHTLLSLEERSGKTLSGATMEVLSQVANLAASADDAADETQPLLAELMSVPGIDSAGGAVEPAADEVVERTAPLAPLVEHRQRLALLQTGRGR